MKLVKSTDIIPMTSKVRNGNFAFQVERTLHDT